MAWNPAAARGSGFQPRKELSKNLSGGGVFIRIIKKNSKGFDKVAVIDGKCNPAINIWPEYYKKLSIL